ncbi:MULTISPECIES: DUF2288 domain-containing protein [unclassified Roseofilum]|uniref:DUF2288 domain-containing protein n=1 Tax=unclassified Roseofilum TaxID=2620099 RepID=UPI000E8584BC|nr:MULTISPECIES: DUF2288 domain-containing protein [unclassified Roseofilum]MBP0009380.1 DUF2288 domain-containing protein [Roseofilum sp. Belize Diploria]MBP0033847.1 DUF2288 domain-containing protein [Roseofilum sp. Belize BBD 4]MBP0043976.1 DUF2288 domain-containing protein [Roseofilum sp. SBFL]HBQ99944.1 DUF2288 domain-containing protein [Cyanobacteria bacterium UBA11691]
MEDIRERLAQEIDRAQWQWLKPHIARDNVVVVTQGLDLVDVGVAIATDQLTSVQHWISEQLIAKPTLEQLNHWERVEDQQFEALIVQPYVLVQEA